MLSHHNLFLTYGNGDPRCDYWLHEEAADALLSEHWAAVETVAAALAERGRLAGDEAAALAGLPNPTPAV